MTRRLPAKLISREFLETIATIIGERSAATQALKDADAHSGPVKFYMLDDSIIVEKLPNQRVTRDDSEEDQ